MEKKWEAMTSDERQEACFNGGFRRRAVKFASPEAEKLYKERATRIKDAVQMKKKPDRVPVLLIPSFFPAFYSGLTPRDVMYDYEKANKAWKKFYVDFQPDAHFGCVAPGRESSLTFSTTNYTSGQAMESPESNLPVLLKANT